MSSNQTYQTKLHKGAGTAQHTGWHAFTSLVPQRKRQCPSGIRSVYCSLRDGLAPPGYRRLAVVLVGTPGGGLSFSFWSLEHLLLEPSKLCLYFQGGLTWVQPLSKVTKVLKKLAAIFRKWLPNSTTVVNTAATHLKNNYLTELIIWKTHHKRLQR